MPYCVKCRWDGNKKVAATHVCRPDIDFADIYDEILLCPECAIGHDARCHLLQSGRAVLLRLDEEHPQSPGP